MVYKFGAGFDELEEDLEDIPTQPKSDGIITSSRNYSLGMTAVDNGYYTCKLTYTVLTPEEYSELLTFFGLSSSLQAECTIMIPDESRNFVIKNGVIFKPRLNGEDGSYVDYYYRQVIFNVVIL